MATAGNKRCLLDYVTHFLSDLRFHIHAAIHAFLLRAHGADKPPRRRHDLLHLVALVVHENMYANNATQGSAKVDLPVQLSGSPRTPTGPGSIKITTHVHVLQPSLSFETPRQQLGHPAVVTHPPAACGAAVLLCSIEGIASINLHKLGHGGRVTCVLRT